MPSAPSTPRCASASSARARASVSGFALQQRAEEPATPAPRREPRKLLAARLVGLGAIPIAVFCAVYLLVSRLVSLETAHGQAWTLCLALAGAVASLFLLASLAARAVVGEV